MYHLLRHTQIYICVCEMSLYNISQLISWISPPNAAPASARTWPWPIPVLGGYPHQNTPEYVVVGEIWWNPMKSPVSNHVLHNSCIFLLSCSASLDHFSLYKVAKHGKANSKIMDLDPQHKLDFSENMAALKSKTIGLSSLPLVENGNCRSTHFPTDPSNNYRSSSSCWLYPIMIRSIPLLCLLLYHDMTWYDHIPKFQKGNTYSL